METGGKLDCDQDRLSLEFIFVTPLMIWFVLSFDISLCLTHTVPGVSKSVGEEFCHCRLTCLFCRCDANPVDCNVKD